MAAVNVLNALVPNKIYHGDARQFLKKISRESIALSIWSPPYYVGKEYERDLSFADWQELLREVIKLHFPIIKPGGFLAINIADILCFKDESMPKIMAENVSRRKIKLTKEDILAVKQQHPEWNRYQLAAYFECSEQTIDRRLNGNNIRGGKYQLQTRVYLVGELIESSATDAGFYLYDRRLWVKDAAWENSRWHTISYRSVDESEYLYIFWKPGITKVDRSRLQKKEWVAWYGKSPLFAAIQITTPSSPSSCLGELSNYLPIQTTLFSIALSAAGPRPWPP